MSGRILIVDDLATNRIVIRARLAAAFYEPLLAVDGQACLAVALAEAPDLILLDLSLPDMSGQEVLRRLRAETVTRDIPVIALTAAGDGETRMAALAAGADDVICRPAGDEVFLARIRNLLRARAETALAGPAEAPTPGLAEPAAAYDPGATVAVVTDGPPNRLVRELCAQLRGRVIVLSRAQALAAAALGTVDGPVAGKVPDVFIIHEGEADAAGSLRLVSELKSHRATRHSAVCIVGPAGEGGAAAMAFDLGADDAVGPQVTATELAVRTRSILRRKRQGDRRRALIEDNLRLALVDPLTGLHNRRHAAIQLQALAGQALAAGQDFAVMVVDLDRFKAVNDDHGHAAGDAVLVEVARRLRSNLRDTDLVARIGGEEFLVMLPQGSASEARRVAQRLCEAVNERPVRLPSRAQIRVTVSIGVAVSDAGTRGAVDHLVEQADLALRHSKGAGRNQVTYRLTAA